MQKIVKYFQNGLVLLLHLAFYSCCIFRNEINPGAADIPATIQTDRGIVPSANAGRGDESDSVSTSEVNWE